MNSCAVADSAVVDLVAIAAGAAPCVAWYDQFVAGQDPPWTELADALDRLRAAGPIPGRLGDAAGFFLDPPDDPSVSDILAALDRLRAVARVAPDPPPPPTPPTTRVPVRASSKGRGNGTQLALDLHDDG